MSVESEWVAPSFLVIMLFLTLAVYAARIYARYSVAKKGGLDDILISVAIAPVIGLTVSTILAIRIYGFQYEQSQRTEVAAAQKRKITMAIEIIYMVTTTIIKVSILILYHRMAGRLTNAFYYCVWGNLIFCGVYFASFLMGVVLICKPLSHFFDVLSKQHNMHCGNEASLLIACASVSALQDMVICALPIFLVRGLHISRRQKISLCVVFGMAFMTSVCGLLRTYYAAESYFNTEHMPRAGYNGWIWTTVETHLGVICASAPALKILFDKWFPPTRRASGMNQWRQPQLLLPVTLEDTVGQQEQETPLESIHVRHKMDVWNGPREGENPNIFTGTNVITALPPMYSAPLAS
ncbi:integral membrane [Pyrenophora seminiperda CCB06]|uniref:Integral membrane n=1 Tax=Pyrenophora seminiperda CCB06 TaxID=1302712 RepID=A0A3M7M2C0_9PLEO|nr:integral membrane [Pyrenophora seminiperda CCB06]